MNMRTDNNVASQAATTTQRGSPDPRARFASAARTALGEERLNRTGATLYSQPFSLAPGDVYILGTNPGGNDIGKDTLKTALTRLEQGTDAGNDYIDAADWDTHQSKQLQSTVKALLHLFAPGRERNVCAANLIFVRSGTLDRLIEPFWQLVDACWPAHEVLLDIVRPKTIVAYGNGDYSAYCYMLHRCKATVVRRENPEKSGCGATMLKAFSYAAPWGEVRVVGLPHPSRYRLLPADPAPTPWPVLLPNVARFVVARK